ncbi:MAG: carboxypeptidase regulatory-like domain-containing protein [Terriglobia bacterium]
MKGKQIVFRSLVILVVLVCGTSIVTAQYTVGTILGTVTDETGAVIPGARVAVTNVPTGLVRTTSTDALGNYEVLNLPPGGPYSVSVEMQGFKTAVETDIVLNVNDRRVIDFMLQIGAVGETVTVEASAVAIESQSGEVSGLVTAQQVAELPLNGRNFVQLTTLQPGVVTNGVFFGTAALNDPTNPFFGKLATASVNGSRQNGSNWLVDGGNNVDPGANWTINNLPSIDAIQEFKILGSNYTAEFGRSGGGQVNLVTKSGGTDYHGAVWEFFRNNKLDARNFFIDKKPPLRFNQFGFNIGGPVIPKSNWKDRLNFFINAEWHRVRTGGTVTGTVPTLLERAGTFGSALTNSGPGGVSCPAGFGASGNQIPASCLDPNAALVLGLYPNPNRPGSLNIALPNPGTRFTNQQILRLDVVPHESTKVFIRWMRDEVFQAEANGIFQDNLPIAGNFVSWPGENLTINAVSTIGARMVNEFQLSRTYDALNRFGTGVFRRDQLPGFNVAVLFPGQKVNSEASPGTGNIQGMNIVGITGLGHGTGLPFINFSDSYQLADNFSIVQGRHTVKFGLKLALSRKREAESPRGTEDGNFSFDGSFTGDPVADFLLGWADSFEELATLRNSDTRWWDIEPFIQDHVRLGRLSLDFGVRFQYFLQPYDIDDLYRNFDPSAFNPANAPLVLPDGTLSTVPDPFNPTGPPIVVTAAGVPADLFNGIVFPPFRGDRALTKNHFDTIAPRIGFAYDLTGQGKTVLRGGYGIFYDRTSTSANTQLVANPGLTTFTRLENITLASFAAGALPPPGPAGVSAYGLAGNIPNMQQWSLGVQHEVAPNNVAEIRYVGSKGTNLDRRYDLNQPPPSSTGPPDVNRPFQGYSSIVITDQNAKSAYHSLQAQLRGRAARQVNYQFSYTWAHSIDNAPGIFFQFGDHQNSNNLFAEKGNSDFDVRQNFVFNILWDLPLGGTLDGLSRTLVHGWTIGTIATFQSGVPVLVRVGDDRFNLGDGGFLRPDLVGNPNGPESISQWFNTSAFAIPTTARFGTAGRNLVEGPGVNNWDVSIYKNFVMPSENYRVQFRAEFFNIWNHTQFDAVDGSMTSSTFGQITRARTPRQIQFAIKFMF